MARNFIRFHKSRSRKIADLIRSLNDDGDIKAAAVVAEDANTSVATVANTVLELETTTAENANTLSVLKETTLSANAELTIHGDAVGTTVFSGNTASMAITFSNTGTPTGTFGSGSKIPVITVNEKGLITNISNTDVAGVTGVSFTAANNNLRISTADGATYDAQIDVSDKATWTALTSTNTAIRALITSNDTDISNLQTEDGNLWSGITGTNTAIRTALSGNVATLWSGITGTNTAIRAVVATKMSVANVQSLIANETANSDAKFATWSALTSTNTSIRSAISTEVASLVDSAPAALNTLNELAAALGDDENFATTVSTNLGQKLGATASVTLSGDVSGTGSFSSNSVSITTTVADDSHTHDGRYYTESESDAKYQTITTSKAYLANTNAYIATKLNSSSYTAADVLTKIKTVDGSGSGLDADLLDGLTSGSFLRSDANDTLSAIINGSDGNPLLQLYNSNEAYLGSTGRAYATLATNSTTGVRARVGSNYYTMWHAGNDGSGSGLDADTIDGIQASSFLRSDANDNATGLITLNGAISSGSSAKLQINGFLRTGPVMIASGTTGTTSFNSTNEKWITNNAGTLCIGAGNTHGDPIFHDGYHPNADKWTTARTNTVTLTGDVTGSGSASVDGTGNWTVSLSAAVGNDSHTHNNLVRHDNRTISPSEYTSGRLNFGFTSWGNNNTSPYADFLHMRSYTDSSGGSDNLVMFKKSGIGMRIWQQGWGSSTAYSTYADVPLYGINQGSGSAMYASIYYDANDTNYYTDPSSTSYVKYLGRRSHSTGHLVGSYNNVGNNKTHTNPIYTIGSSYNPTDSDLSNMYGIGYTKNDAAYDGINSMLDGWGMYVAAGGTARVGLDGTNGRIKCTGYASAPLYYDYNNTAYYGDFASTSRLNTLNVDILNGSPEVITDSGLFIKSTTNGAGASIYFSDHAGSSYAQYGWIKYKHSDGQVTSTGVTSNDGFLIGGSETTTVVKVEGVAQATTSMYSPIYYDYNNTSYYCDPASTSILSNCAAYRFTSPNDQEIVIAAGESDSYANEGTWNDEAIHLLGESGLHIASSPDNWSSGWAGRNEAFICNSSGNSSLPGNLVVSGALTAASKSFDIEHPTKEGMRLHHGVVEGPEHSVYVRGRLNGDNVIQLPDYWTGLVHEDSITVNLTAVGSSQCLYVEDIHDNKVYVGGADNINCFYTIFATRKDIEQFEVEY